MREEWGIIEFQSGIQLEGMGKVPNTPKIIEMYRLAMDDMTFGETFYMHMAICEALDECRWEPDLEDAVMEKLREITEMIKEGRVGCKSNQTGN